MVVFRLCRGGTGCGGDTGRGVDGGVDARDPPAAVGM